MSGATRRTGRSAAWVGGGVVAGLIGALGCTVDLPRVDRRDARITDDLRMRFGQNSEVRSLPVVIVTQAGAVRLSGFAPTKRERDLAGRIARDTLGVRSVDNAIVLGPKTPVGELAAD